MRKTTRTTKTSRGRLTLNNAAADAPSITRGTLQSVTFNGKTKLVRVDNMEGREFKVVPMVMIVEGVLNGSNGPLFYPKDELAKTPEVWNHKPVVVYHPIMNGKGVSACSPSVLTTHKVGYIMNTVWDPKLNRLKAEAWIEETRANAVDERIMLAINAGETLELSTGLFTDNELTDGEFEGDKYNAIARNYRPDHLAILPDKIGACSIKDGAGFIRNQLNLNGLAGQAEDLVRVAVARTLNDLGLEQPKDERGQYVSPYDRGIQFASDGFKQMLADNALSFDNIRSQLYGLLRAMFPPTKKDGCCDAWIEDVFEDHFIYSNAGKLFKLGYSVSGTKVGLSGEPVSVVRVTEYKPADGTLKGNHNKTKNMNDNERKEIVETLIGNAKSGWTEKNREFLLKLPEEQLQQFASNAAAMCDDEDEDKDKGKKKAVKNEAAPVAPKAVTVDEYIANAPAEVREVLQNSIDAANEEKATLVKSLSENKACAFSAEELEAMPLNQLRKVATTVKNAAPAAARPAAPRFDGQGHQTPKTNQQEPTKNAQPALALPSLSFEKASA